jgi:pyrroloquinoline quinone biosynthesis protein E
MNGKITEISVEVSHRCSLECLFCSSSAGKTSPTGELTFDEIRGVLREGRALGATVLSISGGEPLLFPSIRSVLREAVNEGYTCSLYTCGVLLDGHDRRHSVPDDVWQEIRDICGAAKLKVIFDLQGPDATTVDYLMACDGAFGMVTASIRGARRAGLACEAHVVPMKPNYRRIPEIASLAESLGLSQLSFLRFVPQGRGRDNLDALALSATEFYELQQILLGLKDDEKAGRRKLAFRLGCPVDFLFLLDRSYPAHPCRGGTDAPLVLPDGSVHMCPAWKDLKHLAAGNIRAPQASLTSIWSASDFYSLFRGLVKMPQQITGECQACKELPDCKGGCTAQRILAHASSAAIQECLYLSPDPLCPLLARSGDR